MDQTLFASYAVQAAGTVLAAAIFGSVAQTYRKDFLVQWTRSWLALGVLMAASAVNLAIPNAVPANHPERLAVALVGGAAGYLHLTWLLVGAVELHRGRKVARRSRRIALAAAALFGMAMALVLVNDPSAAAARLFVRMGVRGGFTTAGFLVAAWVVWAARVDGARGVGRTTVAGAFVFHAVVQATYLAATAVFAISGDRPVAALYVGFADFVVVFAMALGVVIWMLEEERRAARDFAERIEELAYHDALTGLPNRQLFLDHLNLAISQARRGQHRLAVYFFDLDRFKVINDSLGHSVGDRLLQVVAHRVRAALRDHDTVARMGGDEFTLLTPVVRSADDAAHVALKVQEAIRQPVVIDGRELFVTASLGISVYPDDGDSADALLKNADTAMYRAKAGGADLFQLYTAEMNAHALELLALETALRRAAAGGELELHYQPIFDMSTGRALAVEAMLRWHHPQRGLLRPNHFLEIAEATGAIVPIGEWALREGCRRIAEWRKIMPGLRLTLNVSRRQLQGEYAELISRVLRDTGLPATTLELDLCETCASQCDDHAIAQLHGLRRLGVRVAIDDFGSGYSSVTQLRAFPVDALKIDTSVVRELTAGMRDARVARAVIALARALGLSVTAEGVEDAQQLELLSAQGCEAWQGYLHGPPVQAHEVLDSLQRRAPAVA